MAIHHHGCLPSVVSLYWDPKAALEAQLNNPNFKDDIDYALFQKYDTNSEQEWKDFMSANWSYQQVVHTIFHLS